MQRVQSRRESKKAKSRIEGIYHRRDGSAVVAHPTKEERDAMLDTTKWETVGIKAVKNPKLGPRIIVYDVPNELTTEIIIEDVHEFTIREIMSMQEFRRSMKVVSRTSREDNLKGNLIVECTSKVYTKKNFSV